MRIRLFVKTFEGMELVGEKVEGRRKEAKKPPIEEPWCIPPLFISPYSLLQRYMARENISIVVPSEKKISEQVSFFF